MSNAVFNRFHSLFVICLFSVIVVLISFSFFCAILIGPGLYDLSMFSFFYLVQFVLSLWLLVD